MDVDRIRIEINHLTRLILDEILEPIHKVRFTNGNTNILDINRGSIECDYVQRFSILECLGREDGILRSAFNEIEWPNIAVDTFGGGGGMIGMGKIAAEHWETVRNQIKLFKSLVNPSLDVPTHGTAWSYYVRYATLDKGLGTGIRLPTWSNYLPTALIFLGPPQTPEHAYFRDFA